MKAKNLHVDRPILVRIWLPALLWAAFLFVLSAVPGAAYPTTDIRYADKMVHTGVYLVLGALCGRAFVLGTKYRGVRALALGAGVASLYGISDELHQLFVPGRSADWHDAAADLFGAVIGVSLWAAISRRRRPPPTS